MDIKERSDEQDWKTWRREENDSPSQFPILLTHQLHFDRSPFQKKDHINWQTWRGETFIYQCILSVWESRGGRIRLLIKITSCPSYTRFIHLSSFRDYFCSEYLLRRVKESKTHHFLSFLSLTEEWRSNGWRKSIHKLHHCCHHNDFWFPASHESVNFICLCRIPLSFSLSLSLHPWWFLEPFLDIVLSHHLTSSCLHFAPLIDSLSWYNIFVWWYFISTSCLLNHWSFFSFSSPSLLLILFLLPSCFIGLKGREKVYFSCVKPGKEKRRISLSNLSHL